MIVEEVIPAEKDMQVREELVSIHALNPFLTHVSSARSYMYSGHLSQAVVLNYGEERIIQTGIEKQLAENTFSAKFEEESRVIKVISRYNGIGIDSVNKTVSLLVMYENLVTGEIDFVEVKDHHKLHQYFGFKYKWNEDIINALVPGAIVPSGTILADSPAVGKNNGYKFGINAQVMLGGHPDVAEDGVIISETMAAKLSHNTYEERTFEFGTDKFPLNLYGDDTTYKPFPDIGEFINEDSVVCVLRDYDVMTSAALNSVYDVQDFDPMYDEAVYVKNPGSEYVNVLGDTVKTSYISDIEIVHAPKFKKEVYTGTVDMVYKYINALDKYNNDIVNTYEEIRRDHYRRYKNNDVPLSERLRRLIVDSMALANKETNKIRYNNRNIPIDIYRVKITICHSKPAAIGEKVTDGYGSKGVIVDIRPDHLMPNGVDMVMDHESTVSRMNPGRLYEQYFNGMSRKGKEIVTGILGGDTDMMNHNDDTIRQAYNVIVGLLKIIDNEQYAAYVDVTDVNTMREIVKEVVEEELFLLYGISDRKRAYQVVLESKGTIYEPELCKVSFTEAGDISMGKNDILIAPMYIILLAKTAENYLAVGSAKLNHYGFPTGTSAANRYRLPYRMNPTKTLGETELRMIVSYAGRLAAIELKDRANSIKTHEHVYSNILTSKTPTNIEKLVDRNKIPYGDDSSIRFINNILNASGVELKYAKDRHPIHKERNE